MVDMSGLHKNLYILWKTLDNLSYFGIVYSRSVLQLYLYHFWVKIYVQSIYYLVFSMI